MRYKLSWRMATQDAADPKEFSGLLRIFGGWIPISFAFDSEAFASVGRPRSLHLFPVCQYSVYSIEGRQSNHPSIRWGILRRSEKIFESTILLFIIYSRSLCRDRQAFRPCFLPDCLPRRAHFL